MAGKYNTKSPPVVTNSSSDTNTPKRNSPSAKELRAWWEKEARAKAKFAESQEALKQLKDITKSTRLKSVTKITKESLRNYLENPSTNESNLRNVSRYLATRCQVYFRLIKYNANMFALNCRNVVPPYSLVEDNNPEDIIKSYYETLSILGKMGLQYEFLKVYITCFTEDVFYGVVYFDENSEGDSMFFLPLNPDYCRIQGVWEDGTFSYAFDMSFFVRNQDLLEFWGDPFDSMYREYQSSGVKWQTVPHEKSVCLKFRADDWETVIPPFAGLLSSFLGLLEEEDILAVASEEEIYKLLVMTLPLIDGSDIPDDFAIDPQTAIDYFNKVKSALPSFVDMILSPVPINEVSFNKDVAQDTTRVQTATETVLNSSGGAQVLNTTKLKTSAAFEAMIKADTEFAISTLLPQTQKWVNSFIANYVDNPSKVNFFEVSVYTKDSLRKELLENGQNGLPTKLAINAMSGFSELDTISLNYLEEECLKLHEKFSYPLSTSYTQTDKESGGQEKDIDDLTDDGLRDRDEDLNGR